MKVDHKAAKEAAEHGIVSVRDRDNLKAAYLELRELTRGYCNLHRCISNEECVYEKALHAVLG